MPPQHEQTGVAELAHAKGGSIVRKFKKYISNPRSQEILLRSALLVCIYCLAFSIRLFSVLRYESVIHEFDPYFNYRSTIKLVTEGTHEFWNWFDSDSWHPLGRNIGGTVFPGLMFTAAAIYKVLSSLTAFVQLKDVCVFTAPFFAGNTALVAYFFGCLLKDRRAGLVSATFMSIVPGYISRSVAGSFDNEAVAIFALINVFYFWVRSVHYGTVTSGVLCAFAYLYMGASWGAYVFVSNLIPMYVFIMFCLGRYSRRLYVAYTTLWVIGSALAMQVRFIGFNHVMSNELLAWNGMFFVLQGYELLMLIRSKLGPQMFAKFLSMVVHGAVVVAVALIALLLAVGRLNPWTGRLLTLIDPTYAKKFIPIIASVSEHQPSTWASYIFDFHMLVFAAPLGMYYCFKKLTDENIFLLTFALTSIYFSGIMVRIMLVAAPAFVLLGGLGISSLMQAYAQDVVGAEARSQAAASGAGKEEAKVSSRKASSKKQSKLQGETEDPKSAQLLGVVVMVFIAYGLTRYINHCQWVTSEAYSSPSIVLVGGSGPHRVVLDDFREAYYWLRHNTKPDAKIMSWWDYGYQITAMGNRSVIVDNNTWNNTHIATVGMAMASNETEALKVMRMLDADYVLVIFGGLSGYQSDDINKFLWMVRIGGGVFPVINEPDYLTKTPQGSTYGTGPRAPPAMLDSLMYKACYHEFGGILTQQNQPPGFDRVRNQEIGRKEFDLEHIEEAFTSEHWIVRIYKVKDLDNRR